MNKPASTPVGLTSVFGEDAQKTKQWQAFIKKNQLKAPALHLTIDFITAVRLNRVNFQ
jgi:hypothetical protein